MKRGIVILLIALPLASVAMGGVILYAAFSDPDPALVHNERILNKTSWRDDERQHNGRRP